MAVNDKKEPAAEGKYTADDVRRFILEKLSDWALDDTIDLNNVENNKILDTPLTQLGVDSYDVLDLIVLCERRFDIDIDLDDVTQSTTVNDIVKFIVSPK